MSEELPENVADLPEVHPASAENQQKKVRGRPIQPGEMAKRMQLSAARAKKLRKEARAKMLSALTESMDLGQELLKAMKGQDEKYLGMIERATRLVGLQHDQSPDAIAQKISLDAKANVKKDSTVKLILEDMTKPEEG